MECGLVRPTETTTATTAATTATTAAASATATTARNGIQHATVTSLSTTIAATQQSWRTTRIEVFATGLARNVSTRAWRSYFG